MALKVSEAVAAQSGLRLALGDGRYVVPRLTIGQQRTLFALAREHRAAVKAHEADEDAVFELQLNQTFRIAEILLDRAEPPVGDINEIACSLDELRAAITEIQRFSGMLPPTSGGSAGNGETKSAS